MKKQLLIASDHNGKNQRIYYKKFENKISFIDFGNYEKMKVNGILILQNK